MLGKKYLIIAIKIFFTKYTQKIVLETLHSLLCFSQGEFK